MIDDITYCGYAGCPIEDVVCVGGGGTVSPEWNVVYFNINSGKYEKYNVLRGPLLDDIRKRTEKKDSRQKFSEIVRECCMDRYWCKAEWEILLHESPPKKVDVYDQLLLNWDRFIDYVWRVKDETR